MDQADRWAVGVVAVVASALVIALVGYIQRENGIKRGEEKAEAKFREREERARTFAERQRQFACRHRFSRRIANIKVGSFEEDVPITYDEQTGLMVRRCVECDLKVPVVSSACIRHDTEEPPCPPKTDTPTASTNPSCSGS